MSTVELGERSSGILESLRRDLPSVACRAAVEIDNLILDRTSDLGAVKDLRDVLRESLVDIQEPALPTSLLNPTTAILVNGAPSVTSGLPSLSANWTSL